MRILLQHELKQADDRQRKMFDLPQRKGSRSVLNHYFLASAIKGLFSCKHLPERNSKGIDIRANVRFLSFALLRARKVGGSKKHSRRRKGWIHRWTCSRFRQTEIDHLDRYFLALEMNHEIGRFDVAMNDPFPMSRRESRIDLFDNVECDPQLEWAASADMALQGLPRGNFHRIKVIATPFAKMKNRGNVGMSQAGRCPCLAQKAQACRFIVQVPLADNLKCNWATKITVESL